MRPLTLAELHKELTDLLHRRPEIADTPCSVPSSSPDRQIEPLTSFTLSSYVPRGVSPTTVSGSLLFHSGSPS